MEEMTSEGNGFTSSFTYLLGVSDTGISKHIYSDRPRHKSQLNSLQSCDTSERLPSICRAMSQTYH